MTAAGTEAMEPWLSVAPVAAVRPREAASVPVA